MLKQSADADTATHTRPQAPAPERRKSSIHPVLEQQLLEAADTSGKMRLRKLIEIVSGQYELYESDRTSLETVMRLASDEASAITEQLERESVVRLQAILDHVKDGIISVDHLGRIESMNRTAERFFGVRQTDVMSDLLDSLIPDIAPHGDMSRALEELATAQETTHYDLAAHEVVAKHRRGELMPAEILVSMMKIKRRPTYIVCIRDNAERSKAEEALKDSEARYRVLVENAPEAVVVLDVGSGRFVDCNDNAADFFGMTREQLLRIGPEQVSPPEQADGTPSFGIARGHVEKALAGETPVFEWLHKDAEGKLIPSEVRFVRLPSSNGNLIRASITDITERKQAELVAAGERRALEKIASSEPLAVALSSITEVVERVLPAAICCIRLYDPVKRVLTHVAGKSLPREYVALMDNYPAEIRFGSCAAAIALQRQIIVPDISKDALWEHRRDAALRAGLHACWSTPVTGADGRMLGTFATYLRRTGMPSRRDLELVGRMAQLARIAIERRRSEDALRESEGRFRGLFDNVVEGVYQVTLDGYLLSANPALISMLGYASLEELRAIGLDRGSLSGSGQAPRSDREDQARGQAGRGRIRAEAPRRNRHHHHGERPPEPRRARPAGRVRRDGYRHHRAQARGAGVLRREGAGRGHAPVDRGRRDHDGPRRHDRLHQSGRGDDDRLALGRGLRPQRYRDREAREGRWPPAGGRPRKPRARKRRPDPSRGPDGARQPPRPRGADPGDRRADP